MAVKAVCHLLNAFFVKNFFTGALANDKLLLGLNKSCAQLAHRSVHIVLTLVVDSQTQIAFAFRRTTITLREWCLKGVKLVIETKFLVLLNVASRKNSNRGLLSYSPLTSLAIRVA